MAGVECDPPFAKLEFYVWAFLRVCSAGPSDDLTGVDGNVSMEPFYCDYTGDAGYDYQVCFASDLIGLGAGGSNIGAWGGGCTDCVSPIRRASWGAIKALFR